MKKFFLVLIVVVMCISACGNKQSTIKFSPEEWNSVKSEQRYTMLDNLYKNYNLVGLTENELEALLGTADIKHDKYISDKNNYDEHWGYMVREDEWEGDEYLLVNFKEGVVVDYELEYASNL